MFVGWSPDFKNGRGVSCLLHSVQYVACSMTVGNTFLCLFVSLFLGFFGFLLFVCFFVRFCVFLFGSFAFVYYFVAGVGWSSFSDMACSGTMVYTW